jgi:GNAT superfamily N-acetyltransferase
VTRDVGNGYELSDDRDRIDREAVHAYLTTSYWAKGRTRERQDHLIDESYVVGLYHDGALQEHRGSGLGVELVREIVENGPYADRSWVLHTRDAATLYERFGFRHHERLMQRDAAST